MTSKLEPFSPLRLLGPRARAHERCADFGERTGQPECRTPSRRRQPFLGGLWGGTPLKNAKGTSGSILGGYN